MVRAQDDDVGLNAAAAQLLHGVLGRLRLQFTGSGEFWKERDVNVERVAATNILLQLSNRLNERQRLNVTNGAANLNDHHINVIAAQAQHALLDLVGDVWNDLHRAAEIVAATLACDHGGVDAPRGDVGGLREIDVNEALVVPKVEVGLCAVVGNEHFAVLIGRHGARINVEVGVELDHGDAQTARFEEEADRGGGNSLAERGGDTTSDEYELRRHWSLSLHHSRWGARGFPNEPDGVYRRRRRNGRLVWRPAQMPKRMSAPPNA